MKFVYPIDGIDGDVESHLGSENTRGCYPINKQFQWHGGLHVGEGTIKPLKAIADGVVIAYRVTESSTKISDTDQLGYSTCFVLIQHKYKSPMERELVFYSLYMNLLPKDKMVEKSKIPLIFMDFTVNGTVAIPGGDIGENLRDRGNSDTVLEKLKNGKKLTISEEGSTYYKVEKVDGEVKKGLIWRGSANSNHSFALETNKLNRVVSGNECNIPIDAGAIIGFSGPSALNSDPNYKAAHIEVFTDQDPADFIQGGEGTKDDKKETLKYLQLTTDNKLTSKYPLSYKAGDVVKVISPPNNEHYCEIRMHKQVRIVLRADLKYVTSAKSEGVLVSASYTPRNLTGLQVVFLGLKANSTLTWLESLPAEGDNKPRKVSHTLSDDYPSFWAKKSDLKIVNGQNLIILKSDITLYYKKPTDANIELEVLEDVIFKESDDIEILTDKDECIWYKLKIQDKEGDKEGYIKINDLTKTSAYDWASFGFKIWDYYFGDFLFDINTSYLNMIWSHLEKEGDLDEQELSRAFNAFVMSRKLSKLICYHTSEWGLDYSSLETDVTAYFDRNIDKVDENVKADLEEKKTAALEALKPKVESLSFWKDVKIATSENDATSAGTSAAQTEDEKQSLVPFPTSPKVYHFHPIAFVEQMIKMDGCFCGRDLTVKEVKMIIIALRKTETSVYVGNNKDKLFFMSNCGIPAVDRTYERFTAELNSIFRKYDINTCIRRIHFLAQVYHETDRFRTTKEYQTVASYAPFTGRGLMQLTWKKNYKAYKRYNNVNCVDSPDVISNDLYNSFDSAGWFWKKGKILSNSDIWTPVSNAPTYVTCKNPSYPKAEISYEDDGIIKTYRAVDLNLIADDDYVDVVSYMVNGGANGINERRKYLQELKKIFKYETNCENKI